MKKRFAARIFSHNTLPVQPAQGSLLVSEPFLEESYFRHVVISLIDCGPNSGAMGVVLNNELELRLDEVMEGVERRVPLYCGGPMAQDRLFFIHNLGPDVIPDSRLYAPGLWVGGDFDMALAYVNAGYPLKGHMRFFVGYSGWGGGQLDEEIENDVWAVGSPALLDSSTLLSRGDDSLWHAAVRALGPYYRTWQLHPLKPAMN